MLDVDQGEILIASNDSALVNAIESTLTALGLRGGVAESPEAALAKSTELPLPGLVLLDAEMPGLSVGQYLAAARSDEAAKRFEIVLLTDGITEEWSTWAREGVLDDLIPRDRQNPQWLVRLHIALRSCRQLRGPDPIDGNNVQSRPLDPLTRVYTRASLLSLLFCETDRVQRMKTPLTLLSLDIDDFAHWNVLFGADDCDDLLRKVAERTGKLLRSYDLLGRAGADEFLAVLPGCSAANALMLVERLRIDVFGALYPAGSEAIRLSACFGVASSGGRSPMVVLREVESALEKAKATGPDSVECFGQHYVEEPDPVSFLFVEFDEGKQGKDEA
jgi:diguanylate cyclase (GGDEF)-like protein